MKHIPAFLAALLLATAAQAQKPLEEGTYYIQNATTGTLRILKANTGSNILRYNDGRVKKVMVK